MAAKPDAKPAPEAAAPAANSAAPAAGGGGFKAWLPVLAAVLAAPALSFAVAQFVLVPRLRAQLAVPVPAAGESAEHEGGEAPAEEEAPAEKKGHGEKEEASTGGNYEFSNVVVNLSGTMGTRYLKTSFIVTGIKKASTKPVFTAQKARLTDVTLNVLSSLTLADLEEPGSKNVLREKLVAAYNQTLGKRVVEQVYFSDFVVQ